MSKSLEVWIIEAKNLIAADFTGKSDPFCLVRVGDVTKKTKIKYQNLNPKWKEKFSFPVKDETKEKLVINVLDWDLLSPPDALGQCEILLSTLEKNESLERWATLDGVKSGEVHILIKAVNFGTEPTQQTVPKKSPKPREKSPVPQKEAEKTVVQATPAVNPVPTTPVEKTIPKSQKQPETSKEQTSNTSIPKTSQPVPQLRKEKPKTEIKNLLKNQDEDDIRKERRKSKEVISPIVRQGSQLYYPPNTTKKWKLDGTFNPQYHDIPCPQFDFTTSTTKKDTSTELFFDEDFPCSLESLCNDPNKEVPTGAKMVKYWLRPSEFTQNPKLFVDGTSAGDVKQGALGNCWFVGAMSIIGTRPDILEHSIVELPTNPEKRGRYVFRFFKEGVWVAVEIDDRLPCDANKKLVFAHCFDANEIWVPLMEKAYAKLFGTYQALDAGQSKEGLVDLTGGVSSSIKVEQNQKNEELWTTMKSRTENGSYLMSCSAMGSFEGPIGNTGLLSGHAYAILGVREVKGHKLPWGSHEWNGRWSDDSKEWTPEIIKILNVKFGDDGEFYMCWEDFCKYWTQVDFVHIFNDKNSKSKTHWHYKSFKDSWKSKSAGGVFSNPKNWKTRIFNPQYLLTVSKDCDIVISLCQFDFRYQGDVKEKNNSIGFNVYKYNGVYSDEERLFDAEGLTSILKTDYWSTDRENSAEGKLTKGTYVIIPSIFEPGTEDKFILRVFCNAQFDCKPLIPYEGGYQQIEIAHKWTNENAGGCMNHDTWINNDQFILESDKKVKVHLITQQFAEKPTDSFVYIFKGNPNGTKVYHGELVDSKEKVSFKALNQRVFDINLQPNVPYALMPCTFKPNMLGDFNLIVSWKKDQNADVKMRQCKLLETVSIDDQWTNLSSGGCMNNQNSWLKNPRYSLKIDNDTNLQVMLIQRVEPSYPIGFHILKGDPSLFNIVAQTKAYNYAKVVVEEIKLPAGDYTLVPSTFNQNEKGKFTIQVSSHMKNEFALKKI